MRYAGFLALALVVVAPGASAQSELPGVTITQQGDVTHINIAGPGTFNAIVEEVLALRQRGADADPEILAMIEAGRETLPPPYYLEAFRRSCQTDVEAAREWIALYSIRSRYDGARCVDPTAMQGLQVALMALAAPECRTSDLTAAGKSLDTLERILEEETLFSSTASPWWICSNGMDAMMVALEGRQQDDWLKPETEWPSIREKILEDARASIAKHRTQN